MKMGFLLNRYGKRMPNSNYLGEVANISEVSDVRFEGRHKPIHGGLTVAVRTTDTLKSNI